MTALLIISLFFSALALAMTVWNLSLYRRAPGAEFVSDGVTVCVPARNEQANLAECVESVLAAGGPSTRVLVYDDGSTDRTPEILAELCARHERVSAAETEPLPEGWNGKQHACDRMGRQAQTEWLLFTDADVRFEPGAIARAVAFAKQSGSALVSCFPRQITGSLAERLAVPMIFFILLSYLPIARMRSTLDPGASAACGQFILANREAYLASGGHAAFKDSMHDGVKMPRAFRAAGYRTDLFDGADTARVRMYRGFAETWQGFAKNAYEGLGSVGLLVFVTIAHLVGHVAPWIVLLSFGITGAGSDLHGGLASVAVACQLLQRGLIARRLRQGPVPVLLHPLGVLMMTAIQWDSFRRHAQGRREWRGRTQGASA